MRTIIALAFAALLIEGCGSLRLLQPLRKSPGDWPAFAEDSLHSASISSPLTPPLTLDWTENISSGVGTGSPVIIDSIVFIGNLRGELHALSAETGKSFGWTGLGDAIPGSPVIDNDMAIVALSNSRESLTSYDLRRGKVRWSKRCGDIETSPLRYRERLYLGNSSGTFYCIEAGNGDLCWQFELPENSTSKGIRSSAAAENNTVFFGADDGYVYALDAENGSLRWKQNTGAPVPASPMIASGRVFVGNLRGTVIALDHDSGHVVWKTETDAPVYATMVPIGDLVVFGTLTGDAIGMRANDGTRVWTTPLGGPVNAGGAVARDIVYIGTLRKEVIALRGETGEIIWRTEASGRIKTPPVAACGRLFVVTDEREVMAYRERRP
jgi:outer membrane protein assembly factor BamB